MASSPKKNSGINKNRVSTQQKNVRRQQVFMAVIGIVVILAMVLALMMKY